MPWTSATIPLFELGKWCSYSCICVLTSDDFCRHIVNKILNIHAPGEFFFWSLLHWLFTYTLVEGLVSKWARSWVIIFAVLILDFCIHCRMVWRGSQHCLFIWWKICICYLSRDSPWNWCRGTYFPQEIIFCIDDKLSATKLLNVILKLEDMDELLHPRPSSMVLLTICW